MAIKRIYLLLLCLIVCCFILEMHSFGETIQNDSCGIPVVVTRYNPVLRQVELNKDLGAGDFTAELAGVPATVASASVDAGPKRVAIILDASSAIPADEWKLEADMAAYLVRQARAKDRFYIWFVGTDNATVPLLSPSEAGKALKEASSNRPPISVSGERVYDTLFAAARHLNPPDFGDALVLFGHPEDTGSKKDQDQVTALILKRRLRFYAFSFNDPIMAKLPPGFNLNHPVPASLIPKMLKMPDATGYWFSFHAIRDLNLPGQMRGFKDFLSNIYAGIAAPYRLTLSPNNLKDPTKLTIHVVNSKQRNVRKRDLHFPRLIYPCALPSPAKS